MRSVIYSLVLMTLLFLNGCNAQEKPEYPIISSGLTVPDGSPGIQPGADLTSFRWLDDYRLITLAIDRTELGPKGGIAWITSLKIWNVNKNSIETLAKPNVGGLCVGDGFIRYYAKEPYFRDAAGKIIAHYYGPIGQVKKVDETGLLDWATCKLKSEISLPDWAQKVPEINIRRLQPEHGFLVIGRDDVSQWPRSIRLYRPGETKDQGVDVSRVMGYDSKKSIFDIEPKFHTYQKAYYVQSATPDGVQAWWLYPDGRLEKTWQMQIDDYYVSKHASASRMIMTKPLSPISGINTFLMGPLTDEGLYSFANPKHPNRLVKGRIGKEIEISPNGCQVAFLNDDRDSISRSKPIFYYQLQVITLCKDSK